MKTNFLTYNYEKSKERIDDILKTSDNSYEELNYIPSRDKLTFNNGFYVNCTVLFVDIRNSKELPNKYKRPTLARIYRSYISEIVAIINGNDNCVEINIEGDCVWGVFDTPKQFQIDKVFGSSYAISSIVDTLNVKYKKKGYDPISIGIGIDYGRALMIKAGYNGSGLNDIVWMGNVVNESSKLCGYGNKEWGDQETMVSSVIYNNLNDHNKGLLVWNNKRSCYNGNIINVAMNNWVTENE